MTPENKNFFQSYDSNPKNQENSQKGLPAYDLSKHNTASTHHYTVNSVGNDSVDSDGKQSYPNFEYVSKHKREESKDYFEPKKEAKLEEEKMEGKKESNAENESTKQEVLDSNEGQLIMKNANSGGTD